MYSIKSQRLTIAACLACLFAGVPAFAQPVDVTCDEPGWTWVDVGITLTANQPTYWSAATGLGGVSVPPFTILDPGPPPGRPALDGTGDRVLRGFIIAWAVDAVGAEIRWNHLKGDALIVNYDRGSAWEYTAAAFQAVNPAFANGEALGVTPGQLFLDGEEYDRGFDLLLLDFYATGSQPFGNNYFIALDTALTLMPLDIDVRQETDGPVTTKASFTIWNQNETKLTGLDRCVTCWDDTLFSQYGIPNHFLAENLQTNKGKAQIDGLPSQLCNVDFDPGDGLALGADPRDVVSQASSLLGVSVKHLDPSQVYGVRDNGHGDHSDAGEGVIGMGVQSGLIQADVIGTLPPQRPGEALTPTPTDRRPVRVVPGVPAASVPPQPVVRAATDRLSANEKGSLLIFPKVELRWDAAGRQLFQDTFIDLTNDFPGDVQVQMYFVQGDPPFASNGIDANANGVADDCEDRIRWACGGALPRDAVPFRGCEPNVYGPYGSLVECEADCSPRYSCGLIRGNGNNCVPNPQGEFATYEECAVACQRHDCVQLMRGGDTQCIADTNGAYATLGDCESDCGTRYSCTETANGPECVANSNGEFATLGECQTSCQRHSCVGDVARGPAIPTCVPDPAGAYATLSACEANCGVRYSCSADTGARSTGCYEDANGVYDTLAECETDCQGYQCNSVSGVLTCVPDAITPSYGSRAQCEFVCERTFDCDTNGQCVSGSTYTENDCVNNNVCQN